MIAIICILRVKLFSTIKRKENKESSILSILTPIYPSRQSIRPFELVFLEKISSTQIGEYLRKKKIHLICSSLFLFFCIPTKKWGEFFLERIRTKTLLDLKKFFAPKSLFKRQVFEKTRKKPTTYYFYHNLNLAKNDWLFIFDASNTNINRIW